jgi:hypothetical protein
MTITFAVLEGVGEPRSPEFSDLPIDREVVDLKANPINTSFVGVNADALNPIDDAQYFVQQQYLDFLGRKPDSRGLDYWTEQISNCHADALCARRRRVDVSTAFFAEREFQQTGFFIDRLYKVILGRQPSYAEFDRDRMELVAASDLEGGRLNLVNAWLARLDFQTKYPGSMGNEQFVDALLESVRRGSGVDLTSERPELVTISDRASVIRNLVDNSQLVRAEYNPAFVLAEYFGYLRRDPDRAGYEFWLTVLNDHVQNNYQAMVCAFLTSDEYQKRFGSVVTHSNADCGP